MIVLSKFQTRTLWGCPAERPPWPGRSSPSSPLTPGTPRSVSWVFTRLGTVTFLSWSRIFTSPGMLISAEMFWGKSFLVGLFDSCWIQTYFLKCSDRYHYQNRREIKRYHYSLACRFLNFRSEFRKQAGVRDIRVIDMLVIKVSN